MHLFPYKDWSWRIVLTILSSGEEFLLDIFIGPTKRNCDLGSFWKGIALPTGSWWHSSLNFCTTLTWWRAHRPRARQTPSKCTSSVQSWTEWQCGVVTWTLDNHATIAPAWTFHRSSQVCSSRWPWWKNQTVWSQYNIDTLNQPGSVGREQGARLGSWVEHLKESS